MTDILCREEAHNYCELYGGYLAKVKQIILFITPLFHYQHCSTHQTEAKLYLQIDSLKENFCLTLYANTIVVRKNKRTRQSKLCGF